MSTYMKRFVYMSLLYLAAGALCGILSAGGSPGYAAVFAHTHFNLLGFMAMIVFGIGYFILPRFNGAELRWPAWVPVHFWLGNVSLVGMVLFRGLYSRDGSNLWHVLFLAAAAVQAVSLLMFIVNIWVTLSLKKAPAGAAAAPSAPLSPSISLTEDTRIADLIERCPSVREVLVGQGLKMLDVPGHLDKVRKVGVTLGMAAANHGLDLQTLIRAAEDEVNRPPSPARSAASSAAPFDITSETLIGAVLERHPRTNVIFQRYFGDGCLDCPGQSYESIDLACRMHGVDPELFLAELQAAAREA